MYVLQDKPDASAVTKGGNTFTPVATLKDEYGGVSHIAVDDHCYVLYNGSVEGQFKPTAWWYAEAVKALINLPPLR